MRFTKQIIFGLVFIVAIGLIGWGIYGVFLKPAPSCTDNSQNQGETGVDCGGPCVPCEIKSLIPIKVNLVQAFRTTDTTSGVAAEIYNPNPNWAAQSFDYQLDVKDQFGAIIKSLTGTSFIYGGELKYIIEPRIDVAVGKITSSDLVITNPQWVSVNNYQRPDVEVQNVSSGMADTFYVSGKVVNRSEIDFPEANVYAVVYNLESKFIAASKTIIDNVPKFSSKDFKISFAKDLNIYQPSATPYSFARTLKVGDSGDDVTQLQLFLAESGYLKRDPTGYFDDMTRQSMIALQTAGGLPVTGELDDLTRQVLNAGFSAGIATSTPLQLETQIDQSKTKVFVEVKR
jgi:hypothetical protein